MLASDNLLRRLRIASCRDRNRASDCILRDDASDDCELIVIRQWLLRKKGRMMTNLPVKGVDTKTGL